jgi:signal transduction histidine kinase
MGKNVGTAAGSPSGTTTTAPAAKRSRGGKAFLDNEKKIILAFRFVVALVALAFLFGQPKGVHVPWQFYFVMAVFLLSNIVFFFEQAETFDTQRAQKYVFVFDVGMLTVLMLFLGFTNKEFYLVFLLTIFMSAISKKTSHAFAISAVMSGLYVVFALHGRTDVDLISTPFLVRVILFFVVSSFVGHLSEVAESSRRDVSRLTEWKEKAERLAVEQEKMAAVGLLAAGVAHEFNNLLAGIQGYADLARMDPDQVTEFADAISEQCKRAAGLVRDLMSFSRKRGGDPGPVDVGEAVDQVLRLVRKELAARNIEVERHIAQVAHVEAEPGAIERTALNIVNNAIGAMDKDGKLIVSVFARNGDVLLSVKDNGCGMDEEVLSRVFEPFFSTRVAEEGGVVRAAGLGLAVSKRLVERCGGSIEVESAPGKGTVATVSLPAAPKVSEAGDLQHAGLRAASSDPWRHRPDRAEGEQK